LLGSFCRAKISNSIMMSSDHNVGLVAGLMQLALTTATERYVEFISSRLGKAQVMRVRRLLATDEAGLDACISNRGEGER